MNELTIWSKFDSEILTYFRNYGGSPLSVWKELKRLKSVKEAFITNFGLINYVEFMIELSSNDMQILIVIKNKYNLPMLNQ